MLWSGHPNLAKRLGVMASANPIPPVEAKPEGVPRPPPTVGVIYNRHSHHNLTGTDGNDAPEPGIVPDLPIGTEIIVATPSDRSDLARILGDFQARNIDLLVINGGDGTVRDVLTYGLAVWGETWPALAVLPRGKTNALNVDLGGPPSWTLTGVLDGYRDGRQIQRRPIRITPVADQTARKPWGLEERASEDPDSLVGFILGAGAFTTGIRVGQDAHRLGAFNSLAVAVTTAWGVAQAFFGSAANRWRRGIGMEILLGPGRTPLPHSGFGDRERRWIMVATTLDRLPVNMKLFGPLEGGLRMVVMDRARRRLLAMIPAVLAGKVPAWLTRAGVHFVKAPDFELALDDEFIFDGEAFPPGRYHVAEGPDLCFVVP